MKKTLLALAIPAALVAGSASAATVLEDDTMTLAVAGAVEVQYERDANEDIAETDGAIRIDDGELNFKASYKASEDLTAFGFFDLNIGEDQDTGSGTAGTVQNDEIYVGAMGSFGTVKVGTATPFIDDQGVGVDLELKDNGGLGLGSTDPYDQLVQWQYNNEGLKLGLGYVFAQDAAATTSLTEKTAEMTELMAGYDFGDVLVEAYYTVQNGMNDNLDATGVYSTTTDSVIDDDKLKAFALNVEYSSGDYYVGVGMSSNKYESDEEALVAYEIAASMQATEKVKVGIGYAFNDANADTATASSGADESQSSLYANAQYAVAKNTRVYGEVDLEDDGDETGTGFVVGMEVTF